VTDEPHPRKETTVKRLLTTEIDNHALLLQRLALGAVIFPHGAQKLLGWFGGYGFSGTMGFFTNTMHLPAPLAFLVILGESVGALAVIAGLGTRIAAFGITAIMLGAIFTSHVQHGFFMNWFGAQQGEGFEFHLLALALAIPLLVSGGGRFALDTSLLTRLGGTPRTAS
jgi:putative oxidoreductase